MSAEEPRKRAMPTPAIPGWVVFLAMPVTAVATVWVLKGKPGIVGEQEAPEIPMQVQVQTAPFAAQAMPPQMATGAPQFVTPPQQLMAPPVVQLPQSMTVAAPGQQVAVRGAPVIIAGSQRPHLDRGPCTTCHTVVRPNGARMPTIRSDAIMPHPYPGGLCINCHTTVPRIGPLTGVALPSVMQAPPAPKPDANWKGMEVQPITSLTAMQFNTPAGINGVVVTEVEGAAQRAGMRMGDVVMSVNGAPVTDVMSFNAATNNGTLPEGTAQVLREGALVEVPIIAPPAGGIGMTPAPVAGQACPIGQMPAPAPTPAPNTQWLQPNANQVAAPGVPQMGGMGVEDNAMSPAPAPMAPPAPGGVAPF